VRRRSRPLGREKHPLMSPRRYFNIFVSSRPRRQSSCQGRGFLRVRKHSKIRHRNCEMRYFALISIFFASLCLGSLLIDTAAQSSDGIRFTNVTAQTGITFKHVSSPEKKFIIESMSGGAALFDYDNDGLLDIYLINSPTVATAANPRSARSELWRNKGNGTFADVTEKSGLGYPGWGMGVCTGDFNSDGREDVYVACFGPDHLYQNNGDGTFTDVTERARVNDLRWSTAAAFADYDNDGWLDLFVANYVDFKLDNLPEFGKGPTCQYRGIAVQCGPRGLPGAGDALYRNNRDGTFSEVSARPSNLEPSSSVSPATLMRATISGWL
jgi:FG-GAP-like repeat